MRTISAAFSILAPPFNADKSLLREELIQPVSSRPHLLPSPCPGFIHESHRITSEKTVEIYVLAQRISGFLNVVVSIVLFAGAIPFTFMSPLLFCLLGLIYAFLEVKIEELKRKSQTQNI